MVGIGHYAFALFVAMLVCIIAIILKLLFANVRGQRKLLDEQESKLLQLYVSVETLMEDFNDQVKLTTAEIREHELRASGYHAAVASMSAFDLPSELKRREQAQAQAQSMPVPESTSSATSSTSVHSRVNTILMRAAEGVSEAEIAQELGITRNEVLLVIGLHK